MKSEKEGKDRDVVQNSLGYKLGWIPWGFTNPGAIYCPKLGMCVFTNGDGIGHLFVASCLLQSIGSFADLEEKIRKTSKYPRSSGWLDQITPIYVQVFGCALRASKRELATLESGAGGRHSRRTHHGFRTTKCWNPHCGTQK